MFWREGCVLGHDDPCGLAFSTHSCSWLNLKTLKVDPEIQCLGPELRHAKIKVSHLIALSVNDGQMLMGFLE